MEFKLNIKGVPEETAGSETAGAVTIERLAARPEELSDSELADIHQKVSVSKRMKMFQGK